MFEENMEQDLWWSAPEEAPDFGDLPDAGKVLEVRGKESWRSFQLQKEVLAQGFDAIGHPRRALALRRCCNSLVVHRFEHGRTVVGRVECRDLVCPTGMRARSRRLAANICGTIERFCERNPGLQGLMVTLTVKNCGSHELQSTVGRVIRAFGEMMQRASVKRACHAWVRSAELTRNPETREWHVHVHAVWFVERSAYFKRNSPIFIAVPKLRALWQKQMRLDYEPVVDIRPLRGVQSPLGDEGRTSLREILKYVLKPGSLTVMRAGVPVLLGADDIELYSDGNGEPPQPMRCVPLRAVCAALKSRRLVATSRNLQADDDADFTDEPIRAPTIGAHLGRYLCTEFYVWRSRGRTGNFHLVGRHFNDPRGEAFALGP
jgi:plasmid rolling circle replication initiator protein Rep